MKLFLSPHSDDETLFGSFTILRHKPLVVVCSGTDPVRQAETVAAMDILGAEVRFIGMSESELSDPVAAARGIADMRREVYPIDQVWAPAEAQKGNSGHNSVASAALFMFSAHRIHRYCTYSQAGKQTGIEVPFELHWIGLKLRAMACYKSQIERDSTREHFMRDLYEYYAP